MIPEDLLTRAYARGGFAYAEGRYDPTLTKHVHGGFGRCSNAASTCDLIFLGL